MATVDLQPLISRALDLHTLSFCLSQSPTASACSQEIHRSMNVTLTNATLNQLSHILQALPHHPSLRNLQFHSIEWQPNQMQALCSLLKNTSITIHHLTFKRNSFTADSLSQLSDALTKNNGVKEIVLSESSIGPDGAAVIASALKENRGVEELQIWEDSIGSKGAEELSKMIEVNSTLKLLIIFDSKTITATPLISAVLARNRFMEVHIWSADRTTKSLKVVEFVPENTALRVYNLDVSGMCRVACSLGRNSTVTTLDLTGVKLKSRWAREFRWVLEQNRTLKELNLSKTSLKDKGAIYVAAGLFKNHCVERLHLDGNSFTGVGIEHLLCPLSKFSALQRQGNTMLKSLTIGGRKSKIRQDGSAAIAQMLSSNESLTHFGIYDDESLKSDNIVTIFKSLERNRTLRRVSMQGCKGVRGVPVLQAIMETLNVNPWIEEVDLARTPLQASGKTEGINQRLCQNETSHEPEIYLLKDMQTAAPKSFRVFLCGQELSGKSTLCNAVLHTMSPSKLPYLDHMRILASPIEQVVRMPGIKIKTLRDEDNTKIAMWNLAGQHELYSLHDLMFPGQGSASVFLIISSLFHKPSNREPKTSNEIVEDLQYWLRYIVSNSKRAVHQQCMLPNVTVVLTHHDRINQQSDGLQATMNSIQQLRDKFQGFVEFYPTVFTVDARSSASVSKLSHHIHKTCKMILQRVPRVYQLCNDLVDILSEWRRENRNKPAMKWNEFEELCQVKVPFLRIRSRRDNKQTVESRRKAVASSLHHTGEVIYFDELESLILDCEWFCGDVLNQLIRLDITKHCTNEQTNFISRNEFKKILIGSLQSHIPGIGSSVIENLEPNDLIKMMLKFGICCEQDPSDPNSALLIPSNLDDGRWKPQKWQLTTASDNRYICITK